MSHNTHTPGCLFLRFDSLNRIRLRVGQAQSHFPPAFHYLSICVCSQPRAGIFVHLGIFVCSQPHAGLLSCYNTVLCSSQPLTCVPILPQPLLPCQLASTFASVHTLPQPLLPCRLAPAAENLSPATRYVASHQRLHQPQKTSHQPRAISLHTSAYTSRRKPLTSHTLCCFTLALTPAAENLSPATYYVASHQPVLTLASVSASICLSTLEASAAIPKATCISRACTTSVVHLTLDGVNGK